MPLTAIMWFRRDRAHASPGAYVMDDPGKLRTGPGKPYTVFSPFARKWLQTGRRPQVRAPSEIRLPSKLRAGTNPNARGA